MVIPLVEPQICGLLVESMSRCPNRLQIEVTQVAGVHENAVCCFAHMLVTYLEGLHSLKEVLFW
jgi:hypothetical protein